GARRNLGGEARAVRGDLDVRRHGAAHLYGRGGRGAGAVDRDGVATGGRALGRGDGRGDRRRRVHRVLRGAEQGRRRVVHAERVVLLRERRGAGEGQRVGRDRDDDRTGRRNGA